MDFNAFVQAWMEEDSPEGDFARAWNQDSKKPTVTTWDDLNTYLKGQKACPEAIGTANILFSCGVSHGVFIEDVNN